ncbi:MAG: TatD family hydrolase [Gammaproteobacteria bacterium]|nr:TatD family hydrolase [Gammaproteobacteria bacterium]
MLNFIDSHCHLDFSNNISHLIAQAQQVGVSRFVVPSVNYNNCSTVLALSQQYSAVACAFGIHPHFIQSDNKLSSLTKLATAQRNNIVAIGEIGLDGAIATDLTIQIELLVKQLKLAKELDLPVICHAHKAYDPLLKQLRIIKLKRGGVIHGFSGSLVQANEFIKLGFKLGIGGVITYPRANKIRTTVSQLSLENIMLETDSPDMPLFQQQGKPNAPVNIPIIAQTISELMEIDLAQVASQTNCNTTTLFSLD